MALSSVEPPVVVAPEPESATELTVPVEGAYAGNEVEKNAKKSNYWSVAIRMDNGYTRNFTYTNQPPVHEGERVRLIDGGRRLARVGG